MKLPCFGGLPFHARCKYPKLTILTLVSLLIVLFFVLKFKPWSTSINSRHGYSFTKKRVPVVSINWNKTDNKSKSFCHFHTCFEVNDCVFDKDDQIRVHVHSQYEFHSDVSSDSYAPEMSTEYAEILDTIRSSRYYEKNVSEACVIVPPIDTLNQQQHDTELVSVLLNSLPNWKDGQNHLLFSMLPGSYPEFNNTPDFYYGKAMIAGGSFTVATHRYDFDISIPVFNALTHSSSLRRSAEYISQRPRLLVILSHGWQPQELTQQINSLTEKHKDVVLHLETACKTSDPSASRYPWKRCSSTTDEVYTYPDVLQESRYCILLPGVRYGNPDFTDMMMTGCIPVLTYINKDYVLPFSDIVDWTRLTITWLSHDLEGVVSTLEGYGSTMESELRRQVFVHYDKYFSSMAAITMATLDVINRRVFPLAKLSEPFLHAGVGLDILNAPKDEGFTAVVLTYNRVASLFQVIKSLGKVPSLVKILVIWNNISEPPPSVKEWPRVKKPIQIIRSKANKLSNRFYPYKEITTSAVFSLDDDINMLTTDEIEFAFKAWQEFPNRLVGLPGRVHIELSPDEATTGSPSSKATGGHWKYESSWLNNVSLVLTGAAFYHKYYHFLFTHVMPREIRNWVDQHMNCEDIAMNFLISNHTGLPPLKVTPRKKFKCAACKSEESLWNDPKHYRERHQCINIFTQFFNGMPLKAVKFRLDPVLFLDPVADDIKAYPNIGEL